MRLKCPECREQLDQDYRCKNLHQYTVEDGILKLMENGFKNKLQSWLITFEQFRLPGLQKLDFNSLPESGIKVDANIWKARKEDLNLIMAILDKDCKKALEIGSWNGWLANHLVKRGLEVMAVDYFVHDLDGIKAKQYYENPAWISIQMDLEDLTVICERFDLIVVNRCFSYFTDRGRLIDSALNMLTPNGNLVITGLNLVNKNDGEADELKLARKKYFKQFAGELMFKPFKGYFDSYDMNYLESKGFRVYPYRNLKNLIKRKLFRKRTVVFYAIYKNNE